MIPHQQHGSQFKVFAIIYLLISVAVGTAIFFLARSDNKGDADLLEDKSTAVDPAEKPPAPKPKPKPKPKPADSEKKPDKVVKKDEPEPAPEPPPEPPPKPDKPSLTAEELRQIEALYPFPEIKPLMEIVKNWEEVPQHAFPKLVSIRKPVNFEVTQQGKTVARGKLPIGSQMSPLSLQSGQLTLTTGGANPISTTIPVEDTDFKERIETRYSSFVEMRKAQVIAQRNAERDRRLGVLVLEDSLSDWNDGTDPRFDPIKASLRKGEASIYSLADATKWRWGGNETIDGKEYETAFVVIVTEAAFGVSERELKVLLQAGKVVLWLDPATGEAI